jgi:osmotically-inducible protein OsmY
MGRFTPSGRRLWFPPVALILTGALACASMGKASASPGDSAPLQAAIGDEQLRSRVELALREDPYFYDAHVTVTVEHGDVILGGFVFSDWDLRDAIRIATKASEGRRVIDSLSIEVGGRR